MIRESGLHPTIDGGELNATFSVQGDETEWVITFESRGGSVLSEGTRRERNRDYNRGIEVVLARLASLRANITGAFLASRGFDDAPDESRSLSLDEPLPIPLAGVDVRRLRINLCAAQTADRFRHPGAAGGGNRTKRFEIRVTLPEPPSDFESLVASLVGGFGDASPRDVYDYPTIKPTKKSRSAGYIVDVDLKNRIEQAAMEAAAEHYGDHWSLTDVSQQRGLGYDILAERDEEQLYIEVKGTTSLGLSVGVTSREVATAKSQGKTDLFIFWGIRFDEAGHATGNKRILSPWIPSDDSLIPRDFDFVVPPGN